MPGKPKQGVDVYVKLNIGQETRPDSRCDLDPPAPLRARGQKHNKTSAFLKTHYKTSVF